jgi:hypothetical protein
MNPLLLGLLLIAGFPLHRTERPCPREIFANTPIVTYVVWPVVVDEELVEVYGTVDDLDVLGLERPSTVDRDRYATWYAQPPGFPFRLKPKAAETLSNRLTAADDIDANSVFLDNDHWGSFIAFRLSSTQAPEVAEAEVRRYASFAAVRADWRTEPPESARDYRSRLRALRKLAAHAFLTDAQLPRALNTIRADFATMRYPLLTVTHVADADAIRCLTGLGGGLRIDDYWNPAELVEMGALESVDWAYARDGWSAFMAASFPQEFRELIVDNIPPSLDERTARWPVSGPLNRSVERAIRFITFVHVTVPFYLRTAGPSSDLVDRVLKDLAFASSEQKLAELDDEAHELLRSARATKEELDALTRRIVEIESVLRDVPTYESRGIGAPDYVTATQEFRDRHGAHLIETGLWSRSNTLLLGVRKGPNASYDAERILRRSRREARVRADRLYGWLIGSESRLSNALSLAAARRSVEATIAWAKWGILVTLFATALSVFVFADDLKTRARDRILRTWSNMRDRYSLKIVHGRRETAICLRRSGRRRHPE